MPLIARNRILLALPRGAETGAATEIAHLAGLAATQGRSAALLCESPAGQVRQAHAALFAAHPELEVVTLPSGIAEMRAALLRELPEGVDSLVFAGDLSQVTPAVLDAAQCVIAGPGPVDPPADVEQGCALVTSVFQSDRFIRGFLNNSLALTGYGYLIDHIFLAAKLSDAEAAAFADLLGRQKNVLLMKNRRDPGLYSCWNLGIRMARRRYVSNANVDDLRDPDHVVTLLRDLEANSDVLVAASALNPFHDYPADGRLPEERAGWYADRAGRFGVFDIAQLSEGEPPRLVPHNMPHCMPVWRRSLHERYGWFDEARYGTYADWAFWLKALQDGGEGWINPGKLGFYFVNPASHNRRGSDLERLHKVVESDFIGLFLARRDGQPHHPRRPLPAVPRKLALTGHGQMFGVHRNSFNRLVEALAPLDRGDGTGMRFLPFIERYFVWGTDPGEAASADPRPITEDWVGILHVPFDAPEWFNPAVSPEVFMDSDLWRRSRPHCRGIITLAADLEADLRIFDPALRTLSVRHPTELNVTPFDCSAYLARPRVMQVGDWLRKLQAIHRLRAPGHARVMLVKGQTQDYLDREIAAFGDRRDPAVDMRSLVPDDEYDALLSSSVVLCLMYATAANNAVIECIARATPILINPLAAVVEYLGPDYPLYACDEAEADWLLRRPDRVEEAHRYLLRRRQEIDLSYEGFCRDIAASEWYAGL